MAWRPILDGEQADRAWSVLRDIADGLAACDSPAPDLALFWSYLSSAMETDLTLSRAEQAHDRLANHFASDFTRLGLFGGLAGAAWIAAHVADDVDELLGVVDRKLLELLASSHYRDYDLISGLVGWGIYFSGREDKAARTGISRIVDHLAQLGERKDGGVTWHTGAELLLESQRVQFPSGCYDVGIAHGVAGVLALLAKIAARPDAPVGSNTLRDDAARWLLAQRLGEAGFPAQLGGLPPTPARTAWCYGDPGVTLALSHAALLGTSAPADLDAMTLRWMRRSPREAGIVDGGFCHGASGLAHICNRLYHATGRTEYRDAARTWIDHLVGLHKPGDGIGGFCAFTYPDSFRAEPNLLEGAAGIGLVLLAALMPIEPEWDALLLCDLPVR